MSKDNIEQTQDDNEEMYYYNDQFETWEGVIERILDDEEVDNLNELSDDFKVEIGDTIAKPIAVMSVDWFEDSFDTDNVEDADGIWEIIKKALEESIDFEKLNKMLPILYHNNGKYKTYTKQELIDSWE